MQWNSKSFVAVVAAITHILLMGLLKIHCINSPEISSWPCQCQNQPLTLQSKLQHDAKCFLPSLCIGMKELKHRSNGWLRFLLSLKASLRTSSLCSRCLWEGIRVLHSPLFSLPVTSLDLLQENQTHIMDWRKVQIQTLILAISLLGRPWNANVGGVRSLNVILGRRMSLVSTAGLPLDTCTPCAVIIITQGQLLPSVREGIPMENKGDPLKDGQLAHFISSTVGTSGSQSVTMCDGL